MKHSNRKLLIHLNFQFFFETAEMFTGLATVNASITSFLIFINIDQPILSISLLSPINFPILIFIIHKNKSSRRFDETPVLTNDFRCHLYYIPPVPPKKIKTTRILKLKLFKYFCLLYLVLPFLNVVPLQQLICVV